MKTLIIPLLINLLLLTSCKKQQEWNYKIISYTDSSFKHKKDSLIIKNEDTLFSNKKFKLTGFFKIETSPETYEIGELVQGQSVGKWLSYLEYANQPVLSEEKNYLNGILNGSYTSFNPITKKISEIYNFSNGYLLGEQKIYDNDGNLFCLFSQDGKGNYVNDYIVFNPNKEIIYQENFKEEGTGYLKTFNPVSKKITQEGKLLKKKRNGPFNEYIWGYDDPENDSLTITQTINSLYKEDTLQKQVQIFNIAYFNENLNQNVDSIVTHYKNNSISPYSTAYYYNGTKISR